MTLSGFEKIVEARIQRAIEEGRFDNLRGSGTPLDLDDDAHIAQDLRLSYKILKNADCLPPEIELKKEIHKTETLLAGMGETEETYRLMKKLNFMIMKFNTLRRTAIQFECPQHYSDRLVTRLREDEPV